MTESQNSNFYIEFKITQLDDEEPLDLTVSSSKQSEKKHRLNVEHFTNPKVSSPLNVNDPLISTSPMKNPLIDTRRMSDLINLQDFIDSSVIGKPNPIKIDEKDTSLQNAKGAIFAKVTTMQYSQVLATEKSMMLEIIRKDTEREKFLTDLTMKLDLLKREHQAMSAENKLLKDMLAVYKISS